MKKNKLLIIGSEGQLGKEFIAESQRKNLEYSAPPENECDITNITNLKEIIRKEAPSHIINCAAFNAVDAAEREPDKAFLINQHAVAGLANICHEEGIFFIHYSSDYVFNGEKKDFYFETDLTDPLNNYGKSKLLGENEVKKILKQFLIFRLSWVIGKGKQNFLYKILEWTKDKKFLRVSADEVSVPTFTKEIVKITFLAIQKGLTGLYHLTNSGYASRYELAKYFFEICGIKKLIIPVPLSTFEIKTQRPLFSAMSNHKISKDLDIEILSWKESLKYFIKENNF